MNFCLLEFIRAVSHSLDSLGTIYGFIMSVITTPFKIYSLIAVLEYLYY